eukprot:12897776-Prorocentrum_lima.AAC.1
MRKQVKPGWWPGGGYLHLDWIGAAPDFTPPDLFAGRALCVNEKMTTCQKQCKESGTFRSSTDALETRAQ